MPSIAAHSSTFSSSPSYMPNMVTELLTSSASNSIDHREKGGDVPDGHMHDMDDVDLDDLEGTKTDHGEDSF